MVHGPQPSAHHSMDIPQAHPGPSTTLLAFLAGAMVGAAIVATSTWPDLSERWTRQQKHLVEEVHQPPAPPAAAVEAVAPQEWLHDDILGEQFTRNVQFFGEASQRQIANAFVVVIGLGVSAMTLAMRACGPDWCCRLADMTQQHGQFNLRARCQHGTCHTLPQHSSAWRLVAADICTAICICNASRLGTHRAQTGEAEMQQVLQLLLCGLACGHAVTCSMGQWMFC